MNQYQQDFRTQTFASIFTMVGKTFKEIMLGGGLYVIFAIVALLPMIGILATVDWTPFTQLTDITDQEELAMIMMQTITDIIAGFGTKEALLMTLSFILLLMTGAWYTAYTMLAVEMRVKGHSWSFSELIQRSFSLNVIWVMLFQVFIILLYFLVISLGAFSGGVMHPGMVFILFIGFILLILKFIQAQPAIVHRHLGVGQAIAYSNSKVSVSQVFKYLGIAFLSFIGLIVGMMMIMGIAAVLALVPVIGPLLYLVVNFIVNFVIMALVSITQSVLYFKYSEDLEEGTSMGLEDHLML